MLKFGIVKFVNIWYHPIEVIPVKKYTDIGITNVRLDGGFWKKWRENARSMGLMSVYDRFSETGRFGSLDFNWKEGMPDKPHIFWDSDLAKWIEAAAYLLMDKRDAALEKLVDDCVDKIEAHQREDGYFNIYFDTVEPESRFTRYTDHELYDLGHLIEAAVAYYQATGKDKLMQLMMKYASLMDRIFRVEHSAGFDTPGHEEIELALFKLYRATEDEKWLTLMRYFIDTRGNSGKDRTYEVFSGQNRYSQAHIPVREQTTAEGHSVRACYLYAGMADLAWQDGDEALKKACEALFANIAHKRMYVTGGVGSTHVGEAFSFDYDLMNRTAYAETCAALALALFARRMSRIQPKGEYADVAELALYNGMLAGVSLDTTAFFYENPLEIHPDVIDYNETYPRAKDHMPIYRRKKVFDCSCCPPNVLRLIGAVEEFALTQSEDAVYVHHYMGLNADTAFGKLTLTTEYPADGTVTIKPAPGKYALALRIPGWCRKWSVQVNGGNVECAPEDGYIRICREWAESDEVKLILDMPVRYVQAHPALHEDCGRVTVMRGPIVYCLEECDNGKWLKDIRICAGAEKQLVRNEELGVNAIVIPATRRVWPDDEPLYMDYEAPVRNKIEAYFVPYYAWANRDSGEMLVWTDID